MLEKWALAIEHHEARDYELAVKTIEKNDPTAKGYFNIGMIHSMFGWHGEAVSRRSDSNSTWKIPLTIPSLR